MKVAGHVAGALLGLLFALASSMVLFKLGPPPPAMPEGTPVWHIMSAWVPTGFLTFVKVMELVGGVLVAIPLTRNLGLLVLTPIVVNIVAFHALVMGGGVFSPMVVTVVVLTGFLLWCSRGAIAGLVTHPMGPKRVG